MRPTLERFPELEAQVVELKDFPSLGDIADLDTSTADIPKPQRSVKLGDTRVLQKKAPDLYRRLLQQIDLSDDFYRSPEFARFLKEARKGDYRKLQIYLDLIQKDPLMLWRGIYKNRVQNVLNGVFS